MKKSHFLLKRITKNNDENNLHAKPSLNINSFPQCTPVNTIFVARLIIVCYEKITLQFNNDRKTNSISSFLKITCDKIMELTFRLLPLHSN